MTVRDLVLRLLLLLAFVAGGGGIPALDALIYHHANPVDSPRGVHLEPSGSSCHTDLCLMALTAMSGAQDRQASPVPFVDLDRLLPESLGAGTVPASIHPPGPGLPRSPPVS